MHSPKLTASTVPGKGAKPGRWLVLLLVFAMLLPTLNCGRNELVYPEVDFEASPVSGDAPLEVQFTDKSTGSITKWEWDFNGDLVTDSTEQHPVHVFERPGTYAVMLTVSGPAGTNRLRKAGMIRVGSTSIEKWPAFNFDTVAQPLSAMPGTVRTFLLLARYVGNGVGLRYDIQGTCEGKVAAQVKVRKFETDAATGDEIEEELSVVVDCYRIKHEIFIYALGAPTAGKAEITVWIPAAGLAEDPDFLWSYAKAAYEDPDGKTGEWSYYVTPQMKAKKDYPGDGKEIRYAPYEEGTFEGLDERILFGLYGWGIALSRGFTTSGDLLMETGSIEWGGNSYMVTPEKSAIGPLEFDSWRLRSRMGTDEDPLEYTSVLTKTLPLPVYLRLDQKGESERVIEYELKKLGLIRSFAYKTG